MFKLQGPYLENEVDIVVGYSRIDWVMRIPLVVLGLCQRTLHRVRDV